MRDHPIVHDLCSAGLEQIHVPQSTKRLDEDDRLDGAFAWLPICHCDLIRSGHTEVAESTVRTTT